MGIQEFLKANGIEDRTLLVKVFNDILGTTRYEGVIMTFLDNNGVGLKWRLEYVNSRGFINKGYLDKYLDEWGIYEDYVNLRSQRPGVITDSFLRLLD